jgi:hypothetical protein
MASRAKRSGGSDEKPIRPLLLAGVLGLLWFVMVQQGGMEDDVPSWGIGLIVGARLLADVIGGWVVVSALQLVFGLGRLGWARLRARSE